MKIKELMTKDVERCTPFTSLASAVEALWRRDCGVLPVVDSEGRVTGIITDRDIAIALGTRGNRAIEVTVGDAMTRAVFTCGAEDDVSAAISAMKKHRVRRVPVVDAQRHLLGIVSLHDLARAADGENGRVSHTDLVDVLKAIGQPHPTKTGALWA